MIKFPSFSLVMFFVINITVEAEPVSSKLAAKCLSPTKSTSSCVNTSSLIMLDVLQTSVTSKRWWKWWMETSQIITVTGQIHCCPDLVQTPALFPTQNTHAHSLLSHCAAFFFLQPNKITAGMSDRLLILFPVCLSYLVKYQKQMISRNNRGDNPEEWSHPGIHGKDIISDTDLIYVYILRIILIYIYMSII